MQYILDANSSKKIDRYSIENIGIPSLVLMERAALAVTEKVLSLYHQEKVLCVCGSGNNGADGLAVARQLSEKRVDVSILLAAGEEKIGTEEYELQKKIARQLEIPFVQEYNAEEYGIVIDGLFGIGLTRDITGDYATLIEKINSGFHKVIAIDIPSGIDASDGSVKGIAVMAELTVTFGYLKLGLVLYAGAKYAGEVVVADIGFARNAIDTIAEKAFAYEVEDLQLLPKRPIDGNKGTFGKALIVAGSETMGGAAIFSGKAAYRSGCGLVKILTHEVNRQGILSQLPEALMDLYHRRMDRDTRREQILRACAWANCVVLGPGLSTDKLALEIVEDVLYMAMLPIIIDADALNLIASHGITGYSEGLAYQTIITPHVGEMARLCGTSIEEVKKNPIAIAKAYAKKEQVICVLKDARTIVTDGEQLYVNLSGSDAMATGGSGDVLTGVIAGMLLSGLAPFQAAAMGCYIHGMAGTMAGEAIGNRGTLAGDIVDFVGKVFNL